MKKAFFFVRWLGVAIGLIVFDIVIRRACFAVCTSDAGWIGLAPFANFNFAFSLPLPVWAMYGVYGFALCTVLIVATRVWRRTTVQQRFALVLILCGGTANIFERLQDGYVRDFIKVWYGYYNVGDVYILAGIAMLIFSSRELAQKE